MTIYLVRHADSGSRAKWNDADSLRPLTKEGRRQAADLVESLGAVGLTRIYSSPFRRCVQTVAPLAAALNISVIDDARLGEGPHQRALALVRQLAREKVDAVLSSHGDIIPAVLSDLVLHDELDLGVDPRCQKASVWLLESDRTRFITATYFPPPPQSRRSVRSESTGSTRVQPDS